MSSSFDPAARHPVLACADDLDSALKATLDVEVVFMTAADRRAALLRLTRVQAQVSALKLRMMSVSEDVAHDEGARDVAALLTHLGRTDAGADRRDLALAQALDQRWHHLAAAHGRGEVNAAQARVIAHALDELPVADLEADVVERAEAHLVDAAASLGPRDLRVLGRRVLDHVAPEISEAHEAEQLAAEERCARDSTSLTSRRLGDGTTRITLHVPDALAVRLHTYLEAYTSPRHQASSAGAGKGSGEADRIPIARRRGRAFCALLEAVDPRRLPVHGGDATTLIVTVSLDDLRCDLGTAQLGPTDTITAGDVRRLACTADLIPAVLGTESEVLDLGRSSRLFSPAQRKAMVIRDQECRGEGCTVPAAWCEAHHRRRPWAAGGSTDLDDGVLLCSWHHHRAHDRTYDATRMPDGDFRFHRRT